MLEQLDSATADTLSSYTNALQHAQAELQCEEQRLASSLRALHEQLDGNARLRSGAAVVCANDSATTTVTATADAATMATMSSSSSQQQRIEVMRGERLKLQSHIQRLRAASDARHAHMSQLRQPRLQAEATLTARTQQLLALRKAYALSASRVTLQLARHALQPPYTLPQMQQRLQQCAQEAAVLQQRHATLQAAHAAQQQRLRELRAALTATTSTHGGDSNNSSSKDNKDTHDAAMTSRTTTAADADDDNKKNSNDVATVHHDEASTTTTTELAALEARLAQIQTEQQAVCARQQSALAALHAQRTDLKARVRALCAHVEQADAQQQATQQALRRAMDAAEAAHVGGLHCVHCQADIVAQFA